MNRKRMKSVRALFLPATWPGVPALAALLFAVILVAGAALGQPAGSSQRSATQRVPGGQPVRAVGSPNAGGTRPEGTRLPGKGDGQNAGGTPALPAGATPNAPPAANAPAANAPAGNAPSAPNAPAANAPA